MRKRRLTRRVNSQPSVAGRSQARAVALCVRVKNQGNNLPNELSDFARNRVPISLRYKGAAE